MQQNQFLFSVLLVVCNNAFAADAVDSALANPTTQVEQSVQKQVAETQTGLHSESQGKEAVATPAKKSRFEQDNFQQSTSNAQDLFQGDHN